MEFTYTGLSEIYDFPKDFETSNSDGLSQITSVGNIRILSATINRNGIIEGGYYSAVINITFEFVTVLPVTDRMQINILLKGRRSYNGPNLGPNYSSARASVSFTCEDK